MDIATHISLAGAFASALPMDVSTYRILEGTMVITLLVLSLGVHEAAHGWVALKCGDTLARDLGRITLNPFVHVDLFMTIALPLVLFMANLPVFGGAKPVPVNPAALRNPHRDMMLVAIAGPASNLLLAVLFFAIHHLLTDVLGVWSPGTLGYDVLQSAVWFNILLAVFNMIPVPPLDGSRVMTYLLPAGSLRDGYARLEMFGMLLVVLIVFSGAFRGPLINTMFTIERMIREVVTLGGLW